MFKQFKNKTAFVHSLQKQFLLVMFGLHYEVEVAIYLYIMNVCRKTQILHFRFEN